MPTSLEQQRHSEGQQEASETPKRKNAEISGYDEAGLHELVDHSITEIETQVSQVLSSADTQVEGAVNSVGLDKNVACAMTYVLGWVSGLVFVR